MDLEKLKKEALEKIEKASTFFDLEEFSKEYLGKKGKLRDVFSKLKDLSIEERKTVGEEINKLSDFLVEEFEKRRGDFKIAELIEKEAKELIDITIPGKRIRGGHLHILTKTKREIEAIFQLMGFSVAEGPELENEWYNFDALNFAPDHPAREMQDTFFIKQSNRENLSSKQRLVLRTHTSNVQVRYMEKNNPPMRIVCPGRVYRYEATDASHETTFYQIEGLLIDKEVSVAHLKGILERFLKEFFKRDDVKIRLRPSYFPFVEPGFEVDMTCGVCGGKGCSTCKGGGWIELLGAGLVHPNVIKNSGLDPKEWKGLAFGVGIDRLAMMKYKIDDIRWFQSGDLRFLKQF